MKGTKEEKAAWQRQYRKKNLALHRARSRENYRKNGHRWKATHNAACRRRNKEVKLAAIHRYGGKCFCCGESFYMFLAIDHVAGLGNKERKASGFNGGVAFYKWLKRRSWPDGYQVSCHNCNMGRHLNGGICPHQYDEKLDRNNSEAKEFC